MTHECDSLDVAKELIVECILKGKADQIKKLIDKNILTQADVLDCIYLHRTKILQENIDFTNYSKIIQCWESLKNKDSLNHIAVESIKITFSKWTGLFDINQKQEISANLLDLFVEIKIINDSSVVDKYLKELIYELIKNNFISYTTLSNKKVENISLDDYFKFYMNEISAFKIHEKSFKAEELSFQLSKDLAQKEKLNTIVKI